MRLRCDKFAKIMNNALKDPSKLMGNGINSRHFPDALNHSNLVLFARFSNDSGLLEALYPNIAFKSTVYSQIPRKRLECMPLFKSKYPAQGLLDLSVKEYANQDVPAHPNEPDSDLEVMKN